MNAHNETTSAKALADVIDRAFSPRSAIPIEDVDVVADRLRQKMSGQPELAGRMAALWEGLRMGLEEAADATRVIVQAGVAFADEIREENWKRRKAGTERSTRTRRFGAAEREELILKVRRQAREAHKGGDRHPYLTMFHLKNPSNELSLSAHADAVRAYCSGASMKPPPLSSGSIRRSMPMVLKKEKKGI